MPVPRVACFLTVLICLLTACQPSSSSSCQASEFALPAGANPITFACGKAVISNPAVTLEIAVEIAQTPAESERGLMYRSKLPDKQGMFFKYATPQDPKFVGFWMKNTLIALDVAFFDASGVIFDIVTLQPCTQNPCKVYQTTAPYVGALEVNAGFFSDVGMGLNAKIKLEP
jgi:uncharacterized protein